MEYLQTNKANLSNVLLWSLNY